MDNRRIVYILGLAFFCKVVLASIVPVYADEAYYFVWTLHPQLSYFDHPPMVSWFIAAAEFLFPFKNALSLRSFFVIASTLTMFTWVAILKRKNFPAKNIEYFLILMALNPLLGPGSIVATPDVPLVLFWSLSYLFFIQVLEKRTTNAYILLGICLGLGFCSKYHIVLFLLAGFIYLIWSKELRKIIFFKSLITILFGLIFSLPVLIWNYNNDWVSFSFQLNHGFGRNDYDWTWTAGFIVGQMLILNPFLIPQIIKRNEPRTDQIFGLSQFLFFLISSFKAVVEANWPITSHLHGTSFVSQALTAKKFKQAASFWIFMYAIFSVVFLLPQTQVLFKNQINSAQIDELLPVVKEYQPLYGPSYQISSLLTWLTRTEVYKLNGLTRLDLFDSLAGSKPSSKEFYVLKHMTSWWPTNYQKLNPQLIKIFEKQQLELFKVTQ